ncbi:MAG TPA: hypothetical protein VGF24_01675 [Vicinamibacterales bacterium]
MGIEVPPKVQALADAAQKPAGAFESLTGTIKTFGTTLAASFSACAIVAVIGRTGEWAGHIDHLSKKLGISAESVQRLDFAAQQSGSSIDAIGQSIAILSRHLVAGDTSAVTALERLGLAGNAITNLPPLTVPTGDDPTGMPETQPPGEGCSSGTGGRYVNFQGGRTVRLHGRERVMTEAEGRAEAANQAATAAAIDRLSMQMGTLLRILPDAIRDSMTAGRARYA